MIDLILTAVVSLNIDMLCGSIADDTRKGVIGVVTAKDNGISKVIHGSPAEAAGIKPKDIIVLVDNEKGSKKLVGEVFTFAHLIIKRKDAILEFEVLRLPDTEVYSREARTYKVRNEIQD